MRQLEEEMNVQGGRRRDVDDDICLPIGSSWQDIPPFILIQIVASDGGRWWAEF